MRLLLVGRKVLDSAAISNYSDAQSYYLSRALNDIGVETFFFNSKFSDEDDYVANVIDSYNSCGADHIVALGVRHFSKIPKSVGTRISLEIDGLLCQIHDGSLLDDFPCDLNFNIRDDAWRYAANENNRLVRHLKRNWHIGWAADPDIFFPQQSVSGTFKVFVDHSTFVANSPDSTLNILMALKELRDNYFLKAGCFLGFNRLEVKTLNDFGVVDVDLDDICVRPYNRTSISMDSLAKELRESHLFFVTHFESVGMCVIESAMAGSFVYCPLGAINEDRLRTINHQVFKNVIDWGKLSSSNIDSRLNSNLAKKCTWAEVANKLVLGINCMGPSLRGKLHFR